MHNLIIGELVKAGDGKIYLNDDGEKVKLNSRAIPARSEKMDEKTLQDFVTTQRHVFS